MAFRNDIRGGIIQAYLSLEKIAQLDAEPGPRSPPVTRSSSYSSATRRGCVMTASSSSSDGARAAASSPAGTTTWIDGVRIDAANPPTGDSYSNKAFVYVRYEPAHGRFWAEYHVRRNGRDNANLERERTRTARRPNPPSFTVHGVGAGARLFQVAGFTNEVTVWIENLTDELYAEFSNATFFRPERDARRRSATASRSDEALRACGSLTSS
ncbi:MAG TPA: hypothetical protein VKB93_21770 [Thermoanaerobaculia bacterium]|nr:hypothetical protein [Thermoanaerobaculia bacterium]